MAVRAPTVPTVHPHHYLRALFLTLFGVVAAGALIVAASILSVPSSTATQEGVASGLLETAAVIDAHGAAMMDHGRRLADAARKSTGPDREHWIADGEHMVVDGQSMTALANRLRSAARLLGSSPTTRAEVDLGSLSGEAESLIAEGRGAIAHGKAMVDHAAVMLQLARQPGSGVTVADAQLMADDAPNIIDAGERVLKIGQSLRAFVDQLQRSLGR